MKTKYTKELLEEAVAGAVSIADVMRRVGLKKWSGGSQNLIVARLRQYGIDTSHLLGQRANSGDRYKGGTKPQPPEDVLVKHDDPFLRKKGHVLKKALLALGVEHRCACGQGPEWAGKPLVLQVDHINGDPTDNTRQNLRFICPNCHSQTSTFGGRNKKPQ